MAAEARGLSLSRRQLVQGSGVAGLGLLARCGRLSGQAPQSAKVPRIGLLVGGASSARPQAIEVFRQAMSDRGYIVHRWSEYRVRSRRSRGAGAGAVRLPATDRG